MLEAVEVHETRITIRPFRNQTQITIARPFRVGFLFGLGLIIASIIFAILFFLLQLILTISFISSLL